ncbi:acetyl-CoA C-acyltransferase [Ahrensia sp. 13_GOM-1096m]|uniref:thiolase family protein n=1 Tax=Ahrensia sp. 13_GOM-1096m TaxID=1380380 RepID=UPI00047DCA0A
MVDVVIAGAKRTPMGGFQGVLGTMSAPELGGIAIAAAIAESKLSASHIDEVLMGIVLPAGVGQAPARQASIAANIPLDVPCTAISKVCGSGMKAVALGCDQIAAGTAKTIVAGGMESMTRAPYLSLNSRNGARLGHTQLIDHMFFDGLEDAYEKGALMGKFAEMCASKYQLTREAQDDYALASLSRAQEAQTSGKFTREIAKVVVKSRSGEIEYIDDEQPQKARPEKIRQLKPAFDKDGTVTAANASSISDGAAAIVLTSAEEAKAQGLTERARIIGHASHAREPQWFTTAPIGATENLLKKIGWSVEDVDLWEVNEAFAVVPMVFMQHFSIAHEKMNVNGGACALGHPIGASGARIIVTLLNALEDRGLKRGVASICIGGGEGMSIAIER